MMKNYVCIIFLSLNCISNIHGQYQKTAADIDARYQYISDIYTEPAYSDEAFRDSMQRNSCKKITTTTVEAGEPSFRKVEFFDRKGNLTREVFSIDRKLVSNTLYQYSADGKLEEETWYTGRKINAQNSITCNAKGQISQIINFNKDAVEGKQISTFDYDEKGRLIQKTEVKGVKETNITAAIQNAAFITTTRIHYCGNKPDSIITVTASNRKKTSDTLFRFVARYDSMNRIVEVKQYNKHTSITLTAGGSEPGIISHEIFSYSESGQLLRSRQKVPARETDTTFYFNKSGTLEKIMADFKGFPSATLLYCAASDKLSDTLFTVLDSSELVFPNLKIQVRSFSPQGKLLSTTIATGSRSVMTAEQKTEWQYDSQGRIAGIMYYTKDRKKEELVKENDTRYGYNSRGQEVLYIRRDEQNRTLLQTSQKIKYYR